MKTIKDIVYAAQDPKMQVLDLCIPDCEEADVIIYLHGGGIMWGDKKPNHMKPLAEQGRAAVVSANYRLYPKAVFPEFIEDAAAVVNWVKENMQEYIKVRNIFVSGSSAGAYLTAMLAFDPQYLGKYGIKTTDLAYVFDSAQLTTHFRVLEEKGMDGRRIIVDEAAPLYFLHEKTQFPHILIFAADDDWPCRLEQTNVFLKTLEMFGCPKENVVFQLMVGYTHTSYDGSEEFIKIVGDFMDSLA